MNKYKVSKNFKMDISFEELINFNKTCKIDTASTHHFETFGHILLYVSHPNSEEKFTIELGVDDDGIMYEGDYGCEDRFKEIPIEEGLKILNKHREAMNSTQDLERLLVRNRLDNDTVKLIIK